MKELTNYINEKLDINKVNLNDKFPTNGNVKEIIEFLKAQGFKELDDNKIEDFGEYFIEMDKMSAKVYSITPDNGDNIDSLKFADTSEMNISDNNPFFHIMYNVKTKKSKYHICYKYLKYEEVSKKIFLENIKQHFGWIV